LWKGNSKAFDQIASFKQALNTARNEVDLYRKLRTATLFLQIMLSIFFSLLARFSSLSAGVQNFKQLNKIDLFII